MKLDKDQEAALVERFGQYLDRWKVSGVPQTFGRAEECQALIREFGSKGSYETTLAIAREKLSDF